MEFYFSFSIVENANDIFFDNAEVWRVVYNITEENLFNCKSRKFEVNFLKLFIEYIKLYF
jgi:hypothetical protein